MEKDVATVGITDFAQSELGDIVFVDLPAKDAKFSRGQDLATVESVKAVGVVYAPISGSVTEVNAAVSSDNSLVNSAAESKGWLVKLKLNKPDELKDLLSKEQYAKISQKK